MKTLIALLLLLVSSLSYGGDFGLIGVQHQGRTKPLESYARIIHKDITGNERGALQWLAQTLFDPTTAAQEPLFPIKDPLIKQRLSLPEKQKLFSLIELQKAMISIAPQLEKLLSDPPKKPSKQEQRLIELHDQMQELNQLLRSFSALLPLNIDMPADYQDIPPTYRALLAYENDIREQLKTLIREKGEDPTLYTDDEKKLAFLGYSLQQIGASGIDNRVLRVIPGSANPEHLLAPWEAITSGEASPATAQHFKMWEDMIAAYQADQTLPEIKIDAPWRFHLERLTGRIKPFNIALALYALALLLYFKPRFSILALGSGAAIHAIAIVSRIIILDRPPVGTLYESVIFVSLICAFLAFLLRRAPLAVPAGAFTAALLLTIAPALLGSGDNMDMLVAVLNTNFWLATHVLCITAGYGVCILTASLAHIALLPNYKKLAVPIYRLSLAALLLTALGTALGGIWADQSWGRFWGWDPKENGALLIVLWLIWLLHGRYSGNLDTRAFHAGVATLNIIVALAWFGVNLLSVGLHSYGFTTGLATALTAFCTIELIIIGVLWRRYKNA